MGRLPGMIIVGSFFILSSCISGLELGCKPPQKTPERVGLGKRLYENNCTQCHGSKGEGEGWKAADLKVKPRNFTLPFDQWRVSRGDPRKIFDVLKVGIPDTPMAMFHFTDEERWALVYRVMEFSQGKEVAR